MSQSRVGRGPAQQIERHSLKIALALVLLATIRIVATYPVFNHTVDEPAHIACGMEWLTDGVYRWETQHPPLARVAAALGPYLLGTRSQGTARGNGGAIFAEGAAILYHGQHYDRSLMLARLGVLPFFWVACVVVYEWGRRYHGAATAVAALFVFTFLPPVLAHAGLATTDMALTAFLGAAFLTGVIWIERPTVAHAVWFGAATALAVLSKFSVFVYLPACAVVALVWYLAAARPKREWLMGAIKERLPTMCLAIMVALPIIWAGYRFSFGTPAGANFQMPTPEIWSGIQEVIKHNREGHQGYLLGTRSQTGFLLFYPVALAVKTPIPVLLLFVVGLIAVVRKGPHAWIAVCFAAGILLPALASRINIGIRHILPIYLAISLIAAVAAVSLVDRARTGRWRVPIVTALALWFAGSSLLNHPDYLPFFNELAGSHPENILVDSDLDWGQDINRLAQRLRELSAQEVAFGTILAADLERQHGFPRCRKEMDVLNPSPGWNAVSLSNWKEYRFGLRDRYPELKLWPERYPPLERVGKSILLYHFRYR